jgi:hypothetical protein
LAFSGLGEQAGGLDHELHAQLAFQGSSAGVLALTTRISAPLTIEDVVLEPCRASDFLEPTVPLKRPCVESYFEQVGQVVSRDDVADGDDVELGAEQALLDQRAEDEAADAAETIDSDFNSHVGTPGCSVLLVLLR